MSQKRGQLLRERGFEFNELATNRMAKANVLSVKEMTFRQQALFAIAIGPIADDGVFNESQVNADLMRASCLGSGL